MKNAIYYIDSYKITPSSYIPLLKCFANTPKYHKPRVSEYSISIKGGGP